MKITSYFTATIVWSDASVTQDNSHVLELLVARVVGDLGRRTGAQAVVLHDRVLKWTGTVMASGEWMADGEPGDDGAVPAMLASIRNALLDQPKVQA